jgi:hypothetical protein
MPKQSSLRFDGTDLGATGDSTCAPGEPDYLEGSGTERGWFARWCGVHGQGSATCLSTQSHVSRMSCDRATSGHCSRICFFGTSFTGLFNVSRIGLRQATIVVSIVGLESSASARLV